MLWRCCDGAVVVIWWVLADASISGLSGATPSRFLSEAIIIPTVVPPVLSMQDEAEGWLELEDAKWGGEWLGGEWLGKAGMGGGCQLHVEMWGGRDDEGVKKGGEGA